MSEVVAQLETCAVAGPSVATSAKETQRVATDVLSDTTTNGARGSRLEDILIAPPVLMTRRLFSPTQKWYDPFTKGWRLAIGGGVAVAATILCVILGLIIGRRMPQVETREPRAGVPEPPLAVAPFDAAQARANQDAWAKYLGLPVEMTNSIGMKFRFVPPGEFLMGSPESEKDRGSEELQHRVRITNALYLGVYEVTQADYERVMGANPSWFSNGGGGKDRASGLDTSRLPVEYVAWDDAVAFCSKLSSLAEEKAGGREYRLPTEAEWEYACRAGTLTPFHFGLQLNGIAANCDGSDPYGMETKGPYLQRTAAVGSYAANAFGLFDMHGNVWEWCRDWYESEYYAGSAAEDPTGPSIAAHRVRRGGGWTSSTKFCRSAYRSRDQAEYRDRGVGFRIVSALSGQRTDNGIAPPRP
jgi:formylglycine-generating enzyme required for sulfatase activity